MSEWIDFKELRAKLDFEEVLLHYGVEVKRKGDQHHGFCPLPNHNGKKKSASFSANLKRGIFQCFGCGAKGNVLDFAVFMTKADPNDSEALRKVAVELQKQFCPQPPESQKERDGTDDRNTASSKDVRPAIINAPLDFELKGLDVEHPYLLGRGFTSEIIEHFGLGFCSRGLLKDRVAIPLFDHAGRLVGYAGRIVDDDSISEDNPRYRFPGKRERDDKLFEFRKTRFVYNGYRIKTPVDDLIVVEGFTSVWWLHQNGLLSVVGTMGSDCSERQAEIIVSLVNPSGRVWVMPDGNDAGERLAESLLLQVAPHRFVRWVRLNKNGQPTDLSADQLKASVTL